MAILTGAILGRVAIGGADIILNPIQMVNQKIEARKGLSNSKFNTPKRHINNCPSIKPYIAVAWEGEDRPPF